MSPIRPGDSQPFAVSASELARREAAFDRLIVSTGVAAIAFAIDLIVANLPVSALLVLVGVAVLLALRAALASGFRRFATTVWTVSGSVVLRRDERSCEEFALAAVCGLRTKRTTAGSIREIRIDLDGGRSVYVNGLEDLEAFHAALLSGIPQAGDWDTLREAIDFDHPLFYVLLGVAIGLSVALLARIAISASVSTGRWAYAALAMYSTALGVYWLRAKPVSGRYGKRSVLSDYAFGLGTVCVGIVAALAAFLA